MTRKFRCPRIIRSARSASAHTTAPSLQAMSLEQTIVTVSLRIFQIRRIEIIRTGGRKPALHPVHNVVKRIGMEWRIGRDGMSLGAIGENEAVDITQSVLIEYHEGIHLGAGRGEALVDLGGEGVFLGAGGLDFQRHRRSSTL